MHSTDQKRHEDIKNNMKKLFHNCFNIDNNTKCLLISKSAYYNDFSKIMWHWRLELWCWKFSFAIPGM